MTKAEPSCELCPQNGATVKERHKSALVLQCLARMRALVNPLDLDVEHGGGVDVEAPVALEVGS